MNASPKSLPPSRFWTPQKLFRCAVEAPSTYAVEDPSDRKPVA